MKHPGGDARSVPMLLCGKLFLPSPTFAILVEFTCVRRWRNWQTHQLEVLAPTRHRGSSPLLRTILSRKVLRISKIGTETRLLGSPEAIFVRSWRSKTLMKANYSKRIDL